MKKRILILSILSLITFETGYAKEPKNIEITKHTLMAYHDSGEYQKDQANVIDHAMLYLKSRLATEKRNPSSKKLALVLDIDETSLSNYPDMVALGFGGTLHDIIAREGKGTDPVIQPTLELYRYAKQNHVAVFFITGRSPADHDATVQNLEKAGYQNWDGLILKPETFAGKSASLFKINAREALEKAGYEIVLNIGDQQSDLIGKHADKTFKLPNPYYFIG